jgi:hypothetical protein
MKWAYIGSNGLAASAIADGLDASGGVVKAFDSAGRRYDYSYGGSDQRVKLDYEAARGR